MINIVIVDDQQIVREGLKMILSLHDEVNIIGEASNGQELMELLNSINPEVILMDIRMPLMDGIEATRLVKEKFQSIKVIILTTFEEDEYIFNALKNGADGYILKDSDSNEIIAAIKTAYNGNVLLNPKITVKVVEALNSMSKERIPEKENLLHLLTPREIQVVELIAKGKSNKDIGNNLFVTEGTVKNYVSKVLEKLQLNNRTELVIYYNNHKSTSSS